MARRRIDKKARPNEFEFDVALSFAGEDRRYVERVANELRKMGLKVFYDKYEQVNLWGKDLYVHLSETYSRRARFSVLFISRHYASKVWTNHERRAAQSRAFSENEGTILPARFDGTDIPGLQPTIGYVDLRELSPKKLAGMIREKIGRFERAEFLPRFPDRVVEHLFGSKDADRARMLQRFLAALLREADGNPDAAFRLVTLGVQRAFDEIRLMTGDERKVVGLLLFHSCPASLPRNLHIDIELLERLTGLDRERLVALFQRLDCLGFTAKTAFQKTHASPKAVRQDFNVLELEFHPMFDALPFNCTPILDAIARCMTSDYCPTHALGHFVRLDFSSLSKDTRLPERVEQETTRLRPAAVRAATTTASERTPHRATTDKRGAPRRKGSSRTPPRPRG